MHNLAVRGCRYVLSGRQTALVTPGSITAKCLTTLLDNMNAWLAGSLCGSWRALHCNLQCAEATQLLDQAAGRQADNSSTAASIAEPGNKNEANYNTGSADKHNESYENKGDDRVLEGNRH